MSFFDGIIGGAADQATLLLNNQMQADRQKDYAQMQADKQKDFAQFNADLQEQKERTVMQLKIDMGDSQRTEQVDRISKAASNIVDPAISAKRGIINGGISDQSTATDSKDVEDGPVQNAKWTPEMQAAVDQSLEMDKKSAMSDPRVRNQAAIDTGDISPEKAASLNINQQNSESRMQALQDRAQYQTDKIQQLRDAASDRNATQQERNDAYRQMHESDATLKEAQAQLALAKSDPANIGATHEKMSTDLGRINQSMQGIMDSGRVTINRKTGEVTGPDADLYMDFAKSRAAISKKFNDRYSDDPKVDKAVAPSAPSKSSAPAPYGYSVIGQTPDGRTIYQGQNGKKFVKG